MFFCCDGAGDDEGGMADGGCDMLGLQQSYECLVRRPQGWEARW